MKAFVALVHREFLEHRGAFLIAPMVLVALVFGPAILALIFGRLDAHFSGMMLSAAPMRVYETGFLAFGFGWGLYLLGTLFFYCADGFSADRRNNAMLFWKSMPVSDFKILLAKFTATLTIFPGLIYLAALVSGLLFMLMAIATAAFSGGNVGQLASGIAGAYGQIALSNLVTLAVGLLWYMPFIALVGALAVVVGRWAIPLSLLLPAIVSVLEWAVLGGLHPFATHVWRYISGRVDFRVGEGYVENWLTAAEPFSFTAYATHLIAHTGWVQVLIGAVFALAALYLASEYRRRVNDN